MATENTVNVGINLSDNGTIDKATKNVKVLKDVIDQTAASAGKINTGKATSKYGAERALGAGTGASARDFARESAGLSGLVRVYATIAANVYAAGAAFNALKAAADTSIMVKGLDQLGASSGIALGALSLSLVKATDGALSLKDAMTATAQATAGGVSGKELQQLTEIAKKASQVLGRDLGDALNRLTRAVTKLEPELIDELGIITKTGKAYEDYALSVQKPITSLTALEKSHAYTLAVISEGTKKYGQIDLPINQYDRLLAALKNLAQTSLEGVNKYFTPLIEILNTSPTALYGALAAIGALMLRTVIPAVGKYKEELAKSALSAQELSGKTAAASKDAFEKMQANRLKDQLLERKSIADSKDLQLDAAQARLEAVAKKGISPAVKDILAKTKVQDITDADLKKIEDLGKKNTKVAAAYRDIGTAIVEAKTANKDFYKSAEELDKKLKAPAPAGSAASIAASRDLKAKEKASVTKIVSAASTDTAVDGLRGAFKKLGESVKSAELGLVPSLFARIGGGAAIITEKIGGLIGGFGALLGWVGLIISALEIFKMVLSKNGKEVAEFESSLESLNNVTDNAQRVYEKFKDTVSSESLIAAANSLRELNDGINTLVTNFEKANKTASPFDNLTDSVMRFFNSGLQNKLATAVSEDWTKQLQLIEEGPIKEALKSKIQQILGTQGTGKLDLETAINKTDAESAKKLIKDVGVAFEKPTKTAMGFAGAALDVKSAITSINTSSLELLNTLTNKDPLTKFSADLITLGTKLEVSLRTPKTALAAFKDLANDTKQLQFINPDSFKLILDLEAQLPAVVASMSKLKAEEAGRATAIQTLQKAYEALPDKASAGAKGVADELKRQIEKLNEVKIRVFVADESYAKIKGQLDKVAAETTMRGYKLISEMSNIVYKQGLVAINKALVSGVSGPGISQATSRLNIEELELQKKSIRITSSLNDTMLANNAIQAQRNAIDTAKGITDKAKLEGRTTTKAEDEQIKLYTDIATDIGIVANSITSKKPLAPSIAAGLQPEARGMELQARLARSGELEKTTAITSKIEQERIQGILGANREIRQEQDKINQFKAASLNLDVQRNSLEISSLGYLTEAQLSSKQLLDTNKADVDRLVQTAALKSEEADIVDRIKYASDAALDGLDKALAAKRAQIGLLTTQQEKEKKILEIQQAQAVIINQYAKQNQLREFKFQLEGQSQDLQAQELSITQELLQANSSLGKIYGDDLVAQEKALKLREFDLMYIKSKSAAENTRSVAVSKANEEEAKAKAANAQADTSYWQNQKTQANAVYENELILLDRTREGKTKVLELQNEYNTRTKEYGKVFESSFDGMNDAIVEFAKTGKLSFKSLIDDMIANLIKFELKQAQMKMFESSGSFTGFMGKVLGAFGFGSVNPNVGAVTGPGGDASGISYAAAKGGAFDGATRFAMGGAFANSIVDSPTLFKFANGTGLMGEAGPEAIMPLKRDASGTLGVRGGNSGKVEVVVHNYGNQQATTKESTDSRGNRKVEVMVGDMSAGEITRSGSSSQKSIQSTYGLQPALIRR